MPIAVPLPGWSELDEGQRSRRVRFCCIAAVAVSALLYACTWIVGLGFEELYRGFGSALPRLTRAVLATYKFSGLLLLIGLVPCVALVRMPVVAPARRTRLFVLVMLGFALASLWLTLFYTAMYLPVFQMGSAVH